ncbi:MmcQ/YjbR family DNA-binding protein [Breznakia pachnodae]|uniref:DNA-binding protein (MmcQ/YjbR family) n=1 Tax=Breznakia pachnodae TaxID=265178 RepID=A0ABU0E1C1_9FIRM|nr:MmcQ/YjbR family DNA-binding protein [Breznakia pachnodae]MDQ0360678.1 putative DNA-binding protein (MmcQ/YjbR family) [Breznakia pachnodae]
MKDIKKRTKSFIEHGNKLKGAEVYYRDDWECYYYSLNGKCFGMMGDEIITLKGNPQDNEAMREMYKDVIPGYYANKVHWNSVYLNTEELTDEDIFKMIDISYELVLSKMTKKEQKAILEN